MILVHFFQHYLLRYQRFVIKYYSYRKKINSLSLNFQADKGLDIPEWGKQILNDENFQYLYNLSLQGMTYTPEQARLRTGQLLKFFVDNLFERTNNATAKTKMFLLSGHDNVVGLQRHILYQFKVDKEANIRQKFYECHFALRL